MSNLINFNFENLPVRIIDQKGDFWFVANDVCNILEIQNTTDALKALDDDEKNKLEVSPRLNLGVHKGVKEINIINESGLYALILRSRKAMEKGTIQHKFRKSVTSEILPSIRKTGNYSQKTNAQQRQALVTACDKLAVGNTLRSDIYKMVGNQFGVDDVANIPMDKIPEAVAFVYEIILAKQHTPTTTQTNQKDKSHLTQADALILAKVLDYARLYANFAPKIQTPKGQEHITTLYCNNTSNEDDGFFICYRPNYKDDIEKAMTLFRNIAQNSLLPTT